MQTLREEYSERKKEKEKAVDTASIEWVKNNIVFIHEKIDRKTVRNLTSKITKFDSTFGPFKEKLPAISDQISNAEEGLQKVITGKVNDKKASNLLSQLSFLYSAFSSFFTSDLPVILSTPLLKAAKENPEVKLNVLQDPRHKAAIIRDAFKNALVPSGDELKLLKKIYRGNQPLIDAKVIADQMLNLSYNELQELTKAGRVPMVDTMETDSQTDKEMALQESINFLNEKIDKQKMQQMVNSIQKINKKLNFNGIEDVRSKVDELVDAARQEILDNKWSIPGRTSAAKQLIMFYNVLDQMADGWATVSKTFTEDELSPEQQNQARQALEKSAEDSLFGKIKNALGTNHYSGLDPASLANALIDAIEGEATVTDVDNFFKASSGLPEPDSSGEPAGAPIPTKSTQDTQDTQGTEETFSTKSTERDLTTPVNSDKLSKLLDNLKTQGLDTSNTDSPESLQKFIQAVNDAGLSLVDR